jgi:diadenosine tetraphosphate (Ap4A) HIT family hydrolase
MILHPGWADDFEAKRRGEGCPMCNDRGDEDKPHGVRFMAGRWADAYFGQRPVRRGYAYVIWTGRHVAEPTELTAEEAIGFWGDVATAARAIEARFQPIKMNWMALGNGVPHLHVHLVPRHRDDLAAGGPVAAEDFDAEASAPLDDTTMAIEVAALRCLIASNTGHARG